MVGLHTRKTGDLLLLANGVVLVVLVNLLAAHWFFRLDLTEEKRFSIKPPTRELLRSLDDAVYVEVYLEGDLNAGFRRFQKSIRETLESFRAYSGNKVRFSFVDPVTARGTRAQNEFIQELAQKGITPTNVIEQEDGSTEAKLIFPGAIVSYGGFETGVMLLKGNKALSPEEEINQSIEGVEYELAASIAKLARTDPPRVGLVRGHGELDSLAIAGFNNALLEVYEVNLVSLATSQQLDAYDALIIAKPKTPFSEREKYRLDQYLMAGGKALFMIDKLEASMDSAALNENYLALPVDVNLDDQLFRYGVRINYDLVQDRNAGRYPVVTGEVDGKPKLQLLEWPFFPLINHYADHATTRNLDAVITRFISSVDTVKAAGVRKTPLMMTSQFSRQVGAPVNVSVNELLRNVSPESFNANAIPVGYLLEGAFQSLYANRFQPEGVGDAPLIPSGRSAIVVIADGDIARNEVNPRTGQPQSLGFDPLTNVTYANEDLLMNIMAYLTNGDGLITARTRHITIRPLDREKVANEKIKWQVINLALPVVLVGLFGFGRAWWRRKKYAQF